MDFKTDVNSDEIEEEPYSSFKNQKSGKLIEKSEMPMILIGAGLFILIILFIVFIPKKDKVNVDEFKALVAQVSNLEQKIESIERKNAINILEYDASKNPEDPVDAQQMVTWIKSNAEAISAIIQKLDVIEGKTQGELKDPSMVSAPPPAATTAETTETVAPIEKPAPPVQETPKPKPEVAAKPKQHLQPKALAQPKPKKAPQVKAKPPVVASTADANKSSHKVAKGENLYRIAKQYGISVEKLQQLNGMKKGDLTIQSGQKLVVSP